MDRCSMHWIRPVELNNEFPIPPDGRKKSGPADHLRGKTLNLEASQSDRLVLRQGFNTPDPGIVLQKMKLFFEWPGFFPWFQAFLSDLFRADGSRKPTAREIRQECLIYGGG
jgi:hypothetical protein